MERTVILRTARRRDSNDGRRIVRCPSGEWESDARFRRMESAIDHESTR